MFALPGMPHVFNMWPCRTGNGGSPHSHSVKKLFIFCRLADELRCKYVAGLHLSANISSGRAYRPKAMIACLFFFFASENIVGKSGKLSAKFRKENLRVVVVRVFCPACIAFFRMSGPGGFVVFH